jgi:hypothetical protein
MKRLRQLCAVTALTILLTNVASADDGIMHPGYVPPPTPPSATAGVMHPGFTTGEVETVDENSSLDLATEITLSLLQNMLMLF